MKTPKYLIALMVGSVGLSSCDALSTLPVDQRWETGQGNPTGTSGTITNAEASTGIKQALSQGLDNSIQLLSARDGFLGHEVVKILMPPEAQRVERALRGIGMGRLVDDFITNMNRAAESAVREATPVFVNSLSQLTVTDAFNILLSGQQDAATGFFRRTTSTELIHKFSPIVEKAIGDHQVTRHWANLVTAYNQLPMVNEKIETDLTKYVTDKAVDGLFYQIAQEELKIRNNLGGSRSTPTLQKVFDWADKN